MDVRGNVLIASLGVMHECRRHKASYRDILRWFLTPGCPSLWLEIQCVGKTRVYIENGLQAQPQSVGGPRPRPSPRPRPGLESRKS